jgi:hypothetical protein
LTVGNRGVTDDGQAPIIHRPVLHIVGIAAAAQQQLRRYVLGQVADVDVVVRAVAAVAIEGDTLAIACENRRAVQRLAVGEQSLAAGLEVALPDLHVLVATTVFAIQQGVGIEGMRNGTRHRFALPGELFSLAQWRAHAMQLRGVAETRGDDQAAVGEPVDESGIAPLKPAHETGRIDRVGFGDAVEDEITLHHARRRCALCDRTRGQGQECRDERGPQPVFRMLHGRKV